MRTLAVLTSGGDAPGMNAAIRAVVRLADARGVRVLGVRRGYEGLVAGEAEVLSARDVGNIIHRGGTMLGASRSAAFRTQEGRARALAVLRGHGVEGLVVIGGEGSFRGAHTLQQEGGLPVAGVPATIDNDVYGTDACIGFDTAVNTALDAIDRLRDTAESHHRVFFVEVMGRNTGFLALHVALAAGANEVLVPEIPTDLEDLVERLMTGMRQGRASNIVVVSEGDEAGGAVDIAAHVQARVPFEVRVAVLGHIQRGGSPSARDRILGTRLGAAAVEVLLAGRSDVMVGDRGGETVHVPLSETWAHRRPLDTGMLPLMKALAR